MATHQPKKFFVKVDPENPMDGLVAMFEFLKGRAITDEERKELEAELAQPTRKSGRRKR